MFFTAEVEAVAGTFHPLLQPVTDKAVVDMHELHTDRPAIRIAKVLDNLPQRQRPAATHGLAGEASLQIRFRKTVKTEIELRRRRTNDPQRIELRRHVSANTVITNQLIDAFLQDRAGSLFRGSAVSAGPWRTENAPLLECRCDALALRRAIAFRQRFKVPPPVGGHRLRIPEIVLVQTFYESQTEAVQQTRLIHTTSTIIPRTIGRGKYT